MLSLVAADSFVGVALAAGARLPFTGPAGPGKPTTQPAALEPIDPARRGCADRSARPMQRATPAPEG